MKETNVLKLCMLALSQAGCVVWRNNTGALPDATGRMVKYGLCNGSSDIIGIAPGGVFIAIEVKSASGRVKPDQWVFIDNVQRMGGRAGVARTPEEAVKIALDHP